LVSSQLPAVGYALEGKGLRLVQRTDSDAALNLTAAICTAADNSLFEAGMLTNLNEILSGPYATKQRETEIPPYVSDSAAKPLAVHTAEGMKYHSRSPMDRIGGRLMISPIVMREPDTKESQPLVVDDFSSKVDLVLPVSETQHLGILRAYSEGSKTLKKGLKERMPKAVIYVCKGAGNVPGPDYETLKAAEEEGIAVFRIPIPGGRIPVEKIYDVPGHDIPSLDLQLETAVYKAAMALSLMEREGVSPEQRVQTMQQMMEYRWNREFLPTR